MDIVEWYKKKIDGFKTSEAELGQDKTILIVMPRPHGRTLSADTVFSIQSLQTAKPQERWA